MPTPLNDHLEPVDEELLELAALEAGWGMVCAEFHDRYGSPEALGLRLFELESIGLLQIKTRDPDDPRPSADTLAADARQHRCYEDLDVTPRVQCTIHTTDMGFARISKRLSKE